MRFLVAGSSGFLGTRLREELTRAGHDVVRLVRGRPTGADQRGWDPYGASLDPATLADVDVVVNLAGAPTVGNPYSKRWRENLRRSRVATTSTLAEAIGQSERKPVFLAGNATGWYGDHGDATVDESAPSRGEALMTEVCRAWQQAAAPAVDAGARVVFLRTSPVLDRRSEPLRVLSWVFRFGLGGRLGKGTQYFPTISSTDWTAAVRHCAEHDSVSGPVNLSLPHPATNADLTRALGQTLHRPTFLRVPAFALRAAAGDLSSELLGSVRAVPQALLDSGYTFNHPDIGAAVRGGLSV